MSGQPRRDTTSGRVYNDLRNLAARQGRATDELFQLYLLERFLYRLAHSRLRRHLVLKGGTLLAAYELRRGTRDIDVQAIDVAADADSVARLVSEVCAVQVDDGVTFDVVRLDATAIREGAPYEGVRVRVPASLARAQLVLRLDLNVGDPITPAPVPMPYPQLLGGDFEIIGYPLASVLAEKLVTMVELAGANTRDRDVGDIVRIVRTHAIVADELHAACRATASYRQVELQPLAPLLGGLAPRRQGPWAQWRQRTGLETELPERFEDALQVVFGFADPVLSGAVTGGTWDPHRQTWV